MSIAKEADVNHIVLLGNLTADPELRYTQSGKAVANFTLAVSHRTKANGTWQDATDGFFVCSAWNHVAENVVKSLSKGSRVLVSGKLIQRTWQDSDDKKRTSVEIVASNVGPDLSFATAEITKAVPADSQTAEDKKAS